MDQQSSSQNPMARVMTLRDFKLLFFGSLTSLLGDQFALIATPWLVLKLTGDPLALGIVLALEGLPRAVFMLLGGAITDRISPRLVMLIADTVRFFLTAWMALMVVTGQAQIWMVYAFGLGFGLVAGFAIPAENSIVPRLVEEKDLQAGNSLMMGVTQLVGFVGPTVAGILIGQYSSSLTGIFLAFALDAASFVVSAVCLWLIRIPGAAGVGNAETKESVWKDILAGIRYMWTDRVLRMMFITLIAINFLLIGPLQVGIPVLADQRLPEGAVAYGLLMSAFAGGNLAGYLLAGALPRPNGARMRMIVLASLGSFGLVVGLLGLCPYTWVDFGMLVVLGLGNGYIAIIMFTWMQTRTPQEMLGRMMGLVMFCSSGLAPVSQAIAGVVSKWDLTLLFCGAGLLALLVTVWAAAQPELAEFSSTMVTRAVEAPAE
jgi:MFS family permease